jgi:NAD(P)-dependent dehydrogenase (short-subunit alcohol dehydrogenase family)
MPQDAPHAPSYLWAIKKNKFMKNNKVWFVTGASKGLGLSLVKKLLKEGFNVAATSRKIQDLTQAVGNHASFLPLAVDLKTEASVHQAMEQTVDRFGSIDVVVNNAGYGLAGSLEELSDLEARENFDVNVFGSLNVIRQAMPYLRKQQSGHVINISSIGGITGSFPGFGIYCATKFAVVGFSESLAEEAKPFGVHVTVVEPGYFRTSFLSPGSIAIPANPLDVYQTAKASRDLHLNTIAGNQPGDPDKAADAIVKIASEKNPPLHLVLGQDAYDMAQGKIAALKKGFEEWKEVSISTGLTE